MAERRFILLFSEFWTNVKIFLPFRFEKNKIKEDERRAYEAKMQPIWDAEAKAKKDKINRQSMITLAHEAGVKVQNFSE